MPYLLPAGVGQRAGAEVLPPHEAGQAAAGRETLRVGEIPPRSERHPPWGGGRSLLLLKVRSVMDEKLIRPAKEWLEAATKGIRFGPDRLAVKAELREHLEDKTSDMARIFHIKGEEAEREALKRMGDPEEIRKKPEKLRIDQFQGTCFSAYDLDT